MQNTSHEMREISEYESERSWTNDIKRFAYGIPKSVWLVFAGLSVVGYVLGVLLGLVLR